MFDLSSQYAIRAMIYLAQLEPGRLVQAHIMAKELDLPAPYLSKILQQMVRANVLRSKRGPRGGFSLAKPTNKITMLEIIEAVDGPLTGELNLAEQAGNDKYAGKAEAAYDKAISQARSVFQKTKLSALLSAK